MLVQGPIDTNDDISYILNRFSLFKHMKDMCDAIIKYALHQYQWHWKVKKEQRGVTYEKEHNKINEYPGQSTPNIFGTSQSLVEPHRIYSCASTWLSFVCCCISCKKCIYIRAFESLQHTNRLEGPVNLNFSDRSRQTTSSRLYIHS